MLKFIILPPVTLLRNFSKSISPSLTWTWETITAPQVLTHLLRENSAFILRFETSKSDPALSLVFLAAENENENEK